MRRALGAVGAIGAVIGLLTLATGTADALVRQEPKPVTGGGSSFAQPQIEQWRADVARPPFNLRLDYQAAGSTFGRQQYISGQLDYGATDIPFQPDEIGSLNSSPRKDFVYVPISAGGLAFMYNIRGTNGQKIKGLRLSPESVCRAFTEEGIKWNDPLIRQENPQIASLLPDTKVRRVVRSDGSGDSYNLSEWCLARAPQVWRKFIDYVKRVAAGAGSADFLAGRPSSNWPLGYDAVGGSFASDGVANTVAGDASGLNSIGYAEAAFGKQRGIPNAEVQNPACVYQAPEPAAVTVALGYADPRPDGTFTLDYSGPDPRAYFPSKYSYLISQTAGFDPGQGRTLATFLQYAVTKGQLSAERIGYARLSTVLVNLALDQAQKIPGAQARPTDLANPPPPPKVKEGSVGAAACPRAGVSITGAPNPGGTGGGTSGGTAARPGATGTAARPGATGTAGRPGAAAGAGGGVATGAGAGSTAGATGDPASADGTAAAGGTDAAATGDVGSSGGGELSLGSADGATAASASSASAQGGGFSDRTAIGTFLLGMGLMALGMAAGGAFKLRRPGSSS